MKRIPREIHTGPLYLRSFIYFLNYFSRQQIIDTYTVRVDIGSVALTRNNRIRSFRESQNN